jgi:ribosome-interacting GTPase 1
MKEKEIDKEEPIIMHRRDTIEDLCRRLHRTFLDNYRYALIWGKSAKHPGQKIASVDHVLEDGDIVSIYLKR